VIVVPLGIIEAGNALLEPAILALGVVVAMLSSVLPFLFDIYALKRLPRSVFGVLMSAAPAVAALAGVIVLGEMLGPLQWIGIAAITFACAGSAVVISRRPTTSMVNDVTEWID
jgi:inner membrane transporter RhtA